MTNSKELIDLIVDLTVAAAKSKEDGKLTALDALNFVPVLQSLIPGVKGLTSVAQEVLTDPDSEEQLLAYTKEKFIRAGYGEDVLEEIVTDVLDIAINLVYLVDNLKGLRKA